MFSKTKLFVICLIFFVTAGTAIAASSDIIVSSITSTISSVTQTVAPSFSLTPTTSTETSSTITTSSPSSNTVSPDAAFIPASDTTTSSTTFTTTSPTAATVGPSSQEVLPTLLIDSTSVTKTSPTATTVAPDAIPTTDSSSTVSSSTSTATSPTAATNAPAIAGPSTALPGTDTIVSSSTTTSSSPSASTVAPETLPTTDSSSTISSSTSTATSPSSSSITPSTATGAVTQNISVTRSSSSLTGTPSGPGSFGTNTVVRASSSITGTNPLNPTTITVVRASTTLTGSPTGPGSFGTNSVVRASSSITGNNLGAGAIGLQTVTRTSTSLTGQSLGPGADNTYTVTRSSASILGAFSDPSTFSTVSRISSSLDGCISTDSNTCELQYDSLGITDTAIGIKLDPAVTIVSITADDTSLDSEFSDGDTITIIFSDDTNRPPVATKADIDTLFTISDPLGTDYTGFYLTPRILVITINNSLGGSPNTIFPDKTVFTLTEAGNLRNAQLTSIFSTDSSTLQGNFFSGFGPVIRSVVIHDPDDSDPAQSDGDAIILKFTVQTNKAGGANILNKAGVDALFTFSQSLGANYSGEWTSVSVFEITILDATGGSLVIDSDSQSGSTVEVTGPGLKNISEISSDSVSTSPPLAGNFGLFNEVKTVGVGGTAISVTPSTVIAEITLPEGEEGTITFEKRDADGTGENFEVTFISDVIDIAPGNGASCAQTCSLDFTFTIDEVDVETVLSDIKIVHDKNDDGDFDDEGEQLTTTIVEITEGVFIASADSDFNSKFAVGGVKALALGGIANVGSGESSGGINSVGISRTAPSFTKPPASFGFGGKLLDVGEVSIEKNTIVYNISSAVNEPEKQVVKVGEPVEFKFALFENTGGENVQHFEFHINLTGEKRGYYDSETYIMYDKDDGLVIVDPYGLFESVDFDIFTLGVFEAIININISFAEGMSTSDIILRTWDSKLHSQDIILKNAIEIIGLDPEPVAEAVIMDPEPVAEEVEKTVHIPKWIKYSAKFWSDDQMTDQTFAKGIEYLIQNKIIDLPTKTNVSLSSDEKEENKFDWTNETEDKVIQIPPWVKNNSSWWSEGLISDKEFVNAIEFLIEEETIMI